MPKPSPVGPARNRKELSALLDILAPTFNFTRESGDQYAKMIGHKNFRVIRSGSQIAGGCALIPAGQFFGGKSVPMMGVAAVGISPEHRGQRVGTVLMQSILREMRSKKFPISTLYPATLPLYRSVGYEQAGTRYDIRIPAKSLIFKQRAHDQLQMRRITAKDDQAIRKLYAQRAAMTAGVLDRVDFHWHRIRTPRGGMAAQSYILINTATKQPEGYTYYVQKESVAPPDAHHAPLTINLTDLVALTPEAGRKLLAFFADHRSMIDQIIFQGSADDPILKLLPERNYSARLLDHWMVRIIDVADALEARGYSTALNAELHFEISDELLAENHGLFVLTISNGKAKVRKGGRGDLKLDVRGLAALYTGHMSASDLLLTGQLQRTALAEQLSVANATFAGPAPWLGDMF